MDPMLCKAARDAILDLKDGLHLFGVALMFGMIISAFIMRPRGKNEE